MCLGVGALWGSRIARAMHSLEKPSQIKLNLTIMIYNVEVGDARGARYKVLILIIRGFGVNQKLVESTAQTMNMKFKFVEFGGIDGQDK